MQRVTSGDEGAVAVVVAVLMVALLSMGALVVDVGQLYAERRQLQNGADAAALSVVIDCAAPSGCAPTIAADAVAKAEQNADDGAATVASPSGPAVCGSGGGLAPCSPASGLGPWDCRPVPAALTGASYVQVRTETRQAGGGALLPGSLAALLPGNAGYAGTTVRACARASWGGAGAMASAVPLTISNCEFQALVGSPPTAFAPGPPYPPAAGGTWPAAGWEKTLYFHDTTEAAANDCPAGPSGGDDPLSGGFGWLTSTNCTATTTTTGWYPSKPGSSPGNDCKANELDDFVGTLVSIPIYDRTNGLNGASGEYGVLGYAAFVLTGYNLGGAYKVESVMSGSPGVYPCANTPTTGSQRCISGFFTQALTPTTGVIGGPALGAPPVIQMSG